jgi:myo-inositol-1(or 4)-monophosphatase
MTDLDLISQAALEAGGLALELRDKGLQIWYKDGVSPVTNGDLAVDALLKTRLLEARPDYGWLSEETADEPARLATRLSAQRVFMVDPIDGTSAYMNQSPWFVISIAVVEAGRPISAALYAPAPGELYTAEAGAGAKRNGAPIQTSSVETLAGCRMAADRQLFAQPFWIEPWPDMAVERRNAIAYRMALVGAGDFDAAVSRGRKHDWDLAAGDLIAREAGAAVTDTGGRPLIFNTPSANNLGMICAAPALHPLILARTAPIDQLT